MANLAVPAALLERQDIILQDKLNHASLIDGARLARASLKRYRHNDIMQAETILQRSIVGRDSMEIGTLDDRKLLISTDGVFSMDGDIAPLADLKKLADQYHGILLVDDAHGLGVVGDTGRGSLEQTQLSVGDNVLLMGTLGKGFGSFGAFVAGDKLIIEQLRQSARSYIYTTALPAPVAAVSLMSIRLIEQHGAQWPIHLADLIKQFRQGIEQIGLSLMPSTSPIQPLMVGDADKAVRLSEYLYQQGFYVTAIRPPTVPVGEARLRFTLSAGHTKQHVEQLLNCLDSPIVKSMLA
jgi:8-amino-7-oxononanoate synthase